MLTDVSRTVSRVVPWFNLVGTALILLWAMIRANRSQSSGNTWSRALAALAWFQWLMIILFAILLWLSVHHTSGPKAYLPPYSTYYFDKIAQNVVTFISGWIAALVVFVGMWWLFVKRQRGVLLDAQDVILFTLGTAAVGWPEVFVFLVSTFLLAVVWLILLVLRKKRTLNDRLIVSPVILPAAIITLFIARWLLAVTHLDRIRF